ncbi:acetyl-CoA carboxylase biotin carboxylase subunit family protein, partial [Bacteroides caecimuris]|uniref:ATP-grasp domain-containing protein n=1 Tax=Bacteroides caecimuris TaxID=1796613 RepID=UPI0026E53413
MKETTTIAIIGTSVGQSGLYNSAHRKGIRTIGFSLKGEHDFSDLSDVHYEISITEVDRIVDVCKTEKVRGVVSNGSDFTAKFANEIAFKLGLPCNNPDSYILASDKNYVREATKGISGLTSINYFLYRDKAPIKYPCIIKPIVSGGKIGLSIARDETEFNKAIFYARQSCDQDILVEDYIEGLELSVETLSFDGRHYVIQTCEAETSGAPHFVEIAHHLPANISKKTKEKIWNVIPKILDAISFKNGATDIELKIDNYGNIYLIEVNLRGAGGNITNHLIELSTGYDYLGGLIDISTGVFHDPKILRNDYVGDYYLCTQTAKDINLFINCKDEPWLVASNLNKSHFDNIIEVKTNKDRDGY